MADASPVVFGIFKSLKNKVTKAFRVPPKTKSSDLKKPDAKPSQPYMANQSQRAKIDAERARIAAINKAKRESNRKLTEGTNASRTTGIRNRVVAGTAGTGGVATAAYLMSGDATITPKPAPAPSTSSPARTPVADAPTKEFIDWRDRPSRRDARKPFESKSSSSPAPSKRSGISTSSSSKSTSRKSAPFSRNASDPDINVMDVRGAFRRGVKGKPTAMQETKARYHRGQAKRAAKLAAKTESIAKTPEISKRYELSPQQAGDKLLQTAKTLFPKKPAPAHKNPNAFTKRDLVGTDGMSAGEIIKRFDTEGYKTPPKKELTRRPGETLTSFNMRKQRALNAERKADFLSKR